MVVEFYTVQLLSPEIILVALAAWLFIGGTLWVSRSFWTGFAIVAYLVAATALGQQASWPSQSETASQVTLLEVFADGGAEPMSGPLVVDFYAYLVRWLALLAGLIVTPILARAGRRELVGEVLGALMLMIAGVSLVAMAGELVVLFVALELVSIPTYVLLFLGGRGWNNSEATAKYFFLSILASAVLLYGFSFLYGITGTTSLAAMQQALAGIAAETEGFNPLVGVALVLVLFGLGFRVAAVPFHFYAPDVYQGTSNVNAGLLAVVPKIVGMVVLVRLLLVILPVGQPLAWQLVMVLAVLTMTLGNICALWQQNVRRLMAYSSIAHTGYLFIGLAAGLAAGDAAPFYGGLAAVLFYLLVYGVASLGTFAALMVLAGKGRPLETVDQLAGLGRSRPLLAAAIGLFMFSLAGIPPLAGFWGKLTLFASAVGVATAAEATVRGWFIALAVIGLLNAAVAAAYYLRVVAAMYFAAPALPGAGESGQPPAPQAAAAWGPLASVGACAVLVVALGLQPGPALRAAAQAEQSVRQVADEPAGLLAAEVPAPPPARR